MENVQKRREALKLSTAKAKLFNSLKSLVVPRFIQSFFGACKCKYNGKNKGKINSDLTLFACFFYKPCFKAKINILKIIVFRFSVRMMK